MNDQPSLLDPKEQTEIDLHAALAAERKANIAVQKAHAKAEVARAEASRALAAWQEARS